MTPKLIMYWLSIERFDNWKVDQASGFTFLGIGEKKYKLATEIKKGDILITYVSSGYSVFADIREVISDGAKNFHKKGIVYDEPFPYQVDTKPLMVLPEEKWVKIHQFIGSLSFLKPNKDWRQIMRNSLRKIDESDAKNILRAMNKIR